MTTPDISVAGCFAARAARSGGRRALTFDGTTRTYRELADRVARLAQGLRVRGVRLGDRVGYLGENHAALLETFLAAASLGAVFVPLNYRLTGPELTYIIEDAGLHTLLTDPERRDLVDGVRDALSVRRYVAVDGEPGGWEPYESLLAEAAAPGGEAPVTGDQLAVVMYTSGTTGHPKGVMLTHANLWWSVTNLLHTFDVLGEDVTLVASPLFHIAGLNVTIFTTWRRGGEVVLHRSFHAQGCLDDIGKYGVSSLFGAPTMFQMMAALPQFATADLSSVRMVICGGAPVPEALIRLYQDRGISMLNGYGLTETAPSAAFLPAEHALAKLGSVGQPPLFTDIRIVDDGGHEIETPDVAGEICVRGANVTPGYWNNPAATRAAIDPDGWFHTGDVGRMDEEGFLSIVDRKKDIIVTGGENVSSAEVENVLHGHPDILDVAVIGTPHDQWGETVTAVLVPGEQPLELAELREYAGRSLARYKLPRRLITVEQLPRSPAGKVLKDKLRERYAR